MRVTVRNLGVGAGRQYGPVKRFDCGDITVSEHPVGVVQVGTVSQHEFVQISHELGERFLIDVVASKGNVDPSTLSHKFL